MLGDNIYGSERPQDFVNKFEKPYQALLDAKVPFYATLGNHDDPTQRYYKPFNMNGERYYTFCEGRRPLLRARQQLHGPGAAQLARRGTVARQRSTGRSPTSIIRCTRPARSTDPKSICARRSNRSSSNTA